MCLKNPAEPWKEQRTEMASKRLKDMKKNELIEIVRKLSGKGPGDSTVVKMPSKHSVIETIEVPELGPVRAVAVVAVELDKEAIAGAKVLYPQHAYTEMLSELIEETITDWIELMKKSFNEYKEAVEAAAARKKAALEEMKKLNKLEV